MMSSTSIVKFLELETYVHNTESIDKILESIRNNIMNNVRVPIVLEMLWGTFGNRIIRVRTFIDNEEDVMKILKNVVCNAENMEKLLETIDLRLDKTGNLYIRLNKQELITNKILIDDESDDIIRLKFRISRKAIKEGLEKI